MSAAYPPYNYGGRQNEPYGHGGGGNNYNNGGYGGGNNGGYGDNSNAGGYGNNNGGYGGNNSAYGGNNNDVSGYGNNGGGRHSGGGGGYDGRSDPYMAYPHHPAAAPPAPVVQQIVVAPPPPVTPLFVVDSQRRSTQQPGVLVYSAKFSEQRLSCLYSVQSCPFCMESCNDTIRMAKLTHLDVYTNAVVFSKPHSIAHTCDGCCYHHAIATTRYFDHPAFNQPVTSDGNCYGHIYACFACQGSFGEQITFTNACCCDCICNHTNLNHYLGICNCCCNAGCGSTETIFGLKAEEGRRLAAIINEQASIFRANPNQYQLDSLIANGVDTKYL